MVGGVLLLIVAGAGYWYLGQSGGDLTDGATARPPQKAPRLLDGVEVPVAQANPFPVALIIENLITVRPQAGLDQANIVYEALAEGGITRFLALYGLTDAVPQIGPVRSARSYFLDWVHEYGALFGHVGGSPASLSRINSENIFGLNQFFNAPYFVRDPAIAAPHNVFTDSEKLVFALRDKAAPVEGNFTPWQFKDGADEVARPSEPRTITIDYSTFNYKVEYRYNLVTNSYDRYQAGEPFTSSGTPISPATVIVQYVQTGLEDGSRLTMTTTGSGEAVVFRDGLAIAATWRKPGLKDRTQFFDVTSGEEVQFNRGQIWVQIVPTNAAVLY